MSSKLKLLLLIASCYSMPAISQSAIIDLSGYASGAESTQPAGIYDLYDGKEYFHYAPSLFRGHPFYNHYEFIKGDVAYKGKYFKNVSLLYDMVTDQLILLHYNDFYRIQLFKSEVRSFKLGDVLFVNINTPRYSGYFQEMHQGKISLYAKRIKRVKENLEEKRVRKEIEEDSRYYFMKEGELVPVRKLKTLLNEMGGKKNEVKQYLKKNKIKKNKELLFTAAVAYFDQISAHEN